MYTKFDNNRIEITILRRDKEMWRKVFPLLWDPYMLCSTYLYSFYLIVTEFGNNQIEITILRVS